jgi:predicted ATPase/DNA-binding CsgD family transcriptional regulator
LLKSARLLTVTGIGGSGKTRLALKLAEAVADEYEDGVWLVPLAPVLEESLLSQAVASVLDVRERSGESLDASLARHFRGRKALLVLDGCEHLVVACARLVEEMLGAGRELTVLATSQEALRVPGEVAWRVPSLLETEAVRLFVERTRLIQPDFTLNEQTEPVVARVCRRLDGLPLAIELAAAQMRLMTVTELEVRLQDRFRLLTGGSRTAMTRHQTLRATVDWSYERLDVPEKVLFRRIAVFAGTFSLEAAEQVCAGPPVAGDVLASLGRLVDRSMVRVQPSVDGEARYHLLETLRQYAQEQTQEAGDVQVRHRHAAYFARFAAESDEELLGPNQNLWFARLEREQDNLRATLAWALTNEPAMALQITAALGPFWYMRGSLSEGNEWLASASAASPNPSPTLARVLTHAGWVAYWQGDYERSRGLAQASLRLARELGDAMETARAVNLLGGIHHIADEDFEAARRCYQEALEIRQRIGYQWGIPSARNNVALAAYDAGDYEQAERLLRDALAEIDSVGDKRARANSLDSLARVEFELGNLSEARALHRECLVVAKEMGDKVDIVDALDGLARLAIASGNSEHGLTIAGGARAIHDRIGYETPKPWRRRLQRSVDEARAALTAELAASAWNRGLQLTEEETILFALTDGVSSTAPVPVDAHQSGPLTAREREIAALIAAGLSNKQIAVRLKIAERTADAHVEHIRTKLDVHSRAQIAAWATQNRLILAEVAR